MTASTRSFADSVSSRSIQSPRFEWLQTLFCGWFTIGFFVDAYAHHNNVPESFFTPWHGLLYAGYTVASGHLVWAWLQWRKEGRSWSDALPIGYNGSLLGSLSFGAGGLGDLVWHSVFGIEIDVEALFSPSHLLLGIGAVMMAAGPLRAAWRSDRALVGEGWRKALPPLLSLTFVFSMLSFFMQYNSPFTEVWSTVGGESGGSKAQIVMMDASGDGQLRLSYDVEQDDSAPSVSPDGQQIVFMSDRGDGFAIHVMNTDGSGRQVLAQAESAEMYHPAWSPDGSKIAFVRVGDQGDGHDHSHDTGTDEDGDGDDGHLWLMKADGSDQRPLTNGARHDWQPAWSPDGTQIAFTSRVDGNEDVYLISDGGGIPERVTEATSEDGNPTWSPDGSQIAFESDRDGDYAVFSQALAGGEATRLSPEDMTGYAPSWSPAGGTIAFSGYANGQADVYAMDETGGAATNLSRRAHSNDAFANWLPDGSGLVFRSRPPWSDNAFESQAIGSLGILVHTALLMAAILLLLSRWTLPFGSLTLIIASNTALMAVLESEHRMYIVGVVAGLIADLLYRWLRPSVEETGRLRAFAFLLPFTLWTVYQLMLMYDEGLGWSVHMWTGSIVMAGLLGVLMTFLVTGLGGSSNSEVDSIG